MWGDEDGRGWKRKRGRVRQVEKKERRKREKGGKEEER